MSEVQANPANTVTVVIPATLRRFTAQCAEMEVQADTAGEALREVSRRFPQLHPQLFAADDTLRRFINVFVNARDIRHLRHENTALRNADRITILPAIAGG